MPIDLVYVIGAGGHGKVVIDAIKAIGISASSLRVRDGNPCLRNELLLGIPILVPEYPIDFCSQHFHIAIGRGTIRKAIALRFLAGGGLPLTVQHPLAYVSEDAFIMDGGFLAAGAIVGPCSKIGPFSIVNHGAVVDHDCVVGGYTHVAPNATLGGNVKIGEDVLIGSGANLLPGIQVGDGSVIGAGAVVTRNVGPGEVWFGVPAKKVERS